MDGYVISLSHNIKYLGVTLDAKMKFIGHVAAAIKKTACTELALARLMGNTGGPCQRRRDLLTTVVCTLPRCGHER